jgi:hypothetical protein
MRRAHERREDSREKETECVDFTVYMTLSNASRKERRMKGREERGEKT